MHSSTRNSDLVLPSSPAVICFLSVVNATLTNRIRGIFAGGPDCERGINLNKDVLVGHTNRLLRTFEICRCRLMRLMLDVLEWVATRLIDRDTLKIESDDDGYLAYILDNKLGLSVANICLALEPCEFPYYSAVYFFFDHFAQRRTRIPFHDCRDS